MSNIRLLVFLDFRIILFVRKTTKIERDMGKRDGVETTSEFNLVGTLVPPLVGRFSVSFPFLSKPPGVFVVKVFY